MKYYVIINGESSLDIEGLAIESLPAISKPLMRSKREEIDGRNGDIITQLGFSAYDKTLKIGLWGNYDIDEIISYFNQDGIITFSNEPDMYYNFTILNRIDFINQLEAFRKATITIHCQPFKYKEEETETLELEEHQEEGTSFNLEGTIEAPMQIDLKGNTSQVQLSGKNKLGLVGDSGGNVNGIVNNDGTITISGTSNITDGKVLFKTTNNIVAGTYTLTISKALSYVINLSLATGVSFRIPAGSKSITTTLTTDYESGVPLFVALTNGTTYNDTFNIQLTSGSTADYDFEQYCGGTPSPNPSYPQDIHNVSGNNDIVVFGKNLFDKDNANIISGFISDDGTLKSDNIWKTLYIQAQPNTTYTIQKISGKAFRVANFENTPVVGASYISRTKDDTATIITFTTASNGNYLAVSFIRETDTLTEQQILDSIQIEYGQATTYEAYNGTTYPINLPVQGYNTPNLYDPTTAPVIDGCMAVKSVMKLHGVSLTKIKTTYMACNQNTKYLITKTLGGTNYFDVGTTTNTPAINGSLNQCEDAITETSYEITTGANDNYIVVSYWQDSETGDTKGSITIKEYSTKKEELSKIGTYQDYFYKENDKWYLHKEIGKVVLNGSEAGWNYQSRGNNVYRGYITIPNGSTSTGREYALSNYFYHLDGMYETVGNIFINSSQVFLYTNITTIDDFKTWLSTHNTTIYYVLETPTNTEITDSTLLSQLEAIYNAKSKNGETNINQVNNDEMFILGVDYFTGTNSITITNHGNYYSKPKLTLTGTGNIGIYLNDNQIFQVALGTNETIIIDTDKMEAYYESTLKNRQVIGDYNSFKLLSGENTIRISGTFSKLQVDNYSRWI